MSSVQTGNSNVNFTYASQNAKRLVNGLDCKSSSDEIQEENTTNDEAKNILCIIGKNGKVGAAYYNFSDKLLYFYEEMVDVGPLFLVTQTLCREVDPKYVLSFGTTADDFIKCLVHTLSSEDETTVTSDGVTNLPQNFYLLPLKEYSYDICKLIVLNLTLLTNTEETEIKRELYLHSLINFDCRLSVQALGALIKYLEKNWAYFDTKRESIQFLHIFQKSMNNHVLMDLTSFNALHIFQQRSHEAGFKRGTLSANREGLSIFKLFSIHCKSKLGQTCLRNVLLNPIKNMDELNKRLDFIAFSLLLENREFIESLQDNIKYLYDVNNVLIKIQNGRASSHDWKIIYKTIYHTVFVNELCGPFLHKSELLREFSNSVSSDLIGLEQSICNALDFNTEQRGRPSINFGIDETLDAKKLHKEDISKNVNVAARIVVDELPDFIVECTVIYLPEMGHLIAIKEWEQDCNVDELQDLGYQFVFRLSDTLHYKNAMCRELDKCYGDVNKEIIDHENRIIRRLSGFVLKYHRDIREPLRILALIDCFLSMAKLAVEKNYVRPNLNNEHIHEIVEGRHPLMELLITNLESNDFHSGGVNSRVKIITGPNGSGKSIYLKQVGMILYLAHIGSYVPAKSANIGMLHSIHCRIHATESASVRLSAFMIDISQTSKALYNASASSLVLMDEFGRGTSVDEGVALLVGMLKSFIIKNDDSPHILVSTHFQQIINHLPESKVVEHLKMEHIKEEGLMYFLYKIVKGVSSSFAFDIASEIGLDQDIIDRANNIFNCLKNNNAIVPLNINKSYQNVGSHYLSKFLNDLDIPEPDD